tara:strand:- start:1728 stop:2510 length:783 start_codon:yes stop_codon:yes gene_type:complete
MRKKAWGIFVPKKYVDKIFPLRKRNNDNFFILGFILRRISIPITYYILRHTSIKPNSISILNFLLTILIGVFFIFSQFLIGSILLIFWGLLDNLDGELARLKNLNSSLGSALEKYNSDLMYMICLPSINLGLYNVGENQIFYFILSFFACGIYSILRSFISIFPTKKILLNNYFIIFIACQFKNMDLLRKKNVFYSFIFYLWRNLFAQIGLFEIFILIFSILFTLGYYDYLNYFSIIYSFVYFIFDIILILGIYIFTRIK